MYPNSSTAGRITLVGMGAVGTLIMAAGVLATLRPMRPTSIPEHHLLHAGMAIGAGLLAMALAGRRSTRSAEGRTLWAVVATLGPIFGFILMWPSEYAYLMQHPWLHMLDHIGILAFSWLAVFGAQVYVRGLGWPMLILVVGMDAAAASGYGISNPPSPLLSLPVATVTAPVSGTGTSPAANATPPPAAAGPYHFDAAKGASLYASNCAACHQANGKGMPGVFPAIVGNPSVLNPDPTQQIKVVLDGEHGQSIAGSAYSGTMPEFAAMLSDADIADIINHERSSWGNHGKLITPDQVKALRSR